MNSTNRVTSNMEFNERVDEVKTAKTNNLNIPIA